jgi:hypothetical protein
VSLSTQVQGSGSSSSRETEKQPAKQPVPAHLSKIHNAVVHWHGFCTGLHRPSRCLLLLSRPLWLMMGAWCNRLLELALQREHKPFCTHHCAASMHAQTSSLSVWATTAAAEPDAHSDPSLPPCHPLTSSGSIGETHAWRNPCTGDVHCCARVCNARRFWSGLSVTPGWRRRRRN